MKKFTKKEKEMIRVHFNEINSVDQLGGSVLVGDVMRMSDDLCMFCNLAVALGWIQKDLDGADGSGYSHAGSFNTKVKKDKRFYFYRSLYDFLKIEFIDVVGELEGNRCLADIRQDDVRFSDIYDKSLDGISLKVEEIYNELISKYKGCFGDFLVEKVLI